MLLPIGKLKAQSNYTWDGKRLVLDNGSIKRTILYDSEKGSFSSIQIFLKGDTNNLLRKDCPEFSFNANHAFLSGTSGWDFVECMPVSDKNNGKGASIHLRSRQKAPQISLRISYYVYPDLAYIRKDINITNLSQEDVAIENLNIEHINVSLDPVDSWIYTNYARMKKLGTYVGDWDDAVMMIHSTGSRRGVILGNEIPGVMKRSAFNTTVNNLEVGYTNVTQDYPFRKWIKKTENWTSHKVFTGWYVNSDNPQKELNTHYQDFSRRHLDFRINAIKQKPVFVYNTWTPFRTFVSDSLISSVAKAASECGVQEFVIDDGWQVNVGSRSSEKEWGGNYGDWQVDKNKFPNGLKSTFDYIKSLGMKPGLWISIGSATDNAKVYKEHPEWFVKNYKNQPGNLHFVADSSDFYSSCMGTDWVDYIKNTIVKLSKDYGLAYAKLDLSVVVSAYVTDKKVSGCYATNHPYHKDHPESLIVLYDRLLQLFDDIHKEAPDLFIDCTFETAGKIQLMDLAISQHAEGNWLSNFEEPFPIGPLRVRQMAWWRSAAIPASSLVIGNQQFDSPNFDFVFKSLMGTLAIVLGDPRKISIQKRKWIKDWSNFLQNVQKKYNYMEFRQDLVGFGEPAEGSWDGWSRINTETKEGGLVGVFKQDAKETQRTVFINTLDPKATYKILEAPYERLVSRMTGKQLSETGFKVRINKNYGAVVYEIERE
ncbi:MAG TPA: glycoside hydrolase family 36 protein [Cytophagaceae bacterium]